MKPRRLEPTKEQLAASERARRRQETREKIRAMPLDPASKRWALDRLDNALPKNFDEVLKDAESLLAGK